MSQVQKPAVQSRPNPMKQKSERLSRRGLFTSTAALAAFWGAARTATAGPPNDVPGDVDPSSLLTKLIRRITFGINQAELDQAAALGYSGYLEYQLNYTAIDDSAMDARLSSLTTLQMTQLQMYGQTAGLLSNELTEATILRSALSRRQLYQRMVEFWTDHFNIEILKEPCNFLKPAFQHSGIRSLEFT